jgi:hypothetical protein
MIHSQKRKRLQPVIRALVLILALSRTASAGEERHGRSADSRNHADKMVGLQLRIAESKRKPDSVQYYRSIARQRRMRAIVIQSPVFSPRMKR